MIKTDDKKVLENNELFFEHIETNERFHSIGIDGKNNNDNWKFIL